ncbi:hypothetical protein KPH14_003373 [Odynerus spinipes]|uniref:Uncharacterized protein n=1 Tax=Odynerus spinipes TaxID=1348599 RepID=A0AAD9RCH9_9HYME|nr:hypothetical protein KPH14_003373 [Odynerus spinipes]
MHSKRCVFPRVHTIAHLPMSFGLVSAIALTLSLSLTLGVSSASKRYSRLANCVGDASKLLGGKNWRIVG